MATATVPTKNEVKPSDVKSADPVVQPVKIAVQPLKFRVLVGQHSGLDSDMVTRLWRQGEIVECYHENGKPYDLAKRFNQPDAIKFQLVPADTPSSKGLFLNKGNPEADPDEVDAYVTQVAANAEKAGKRLDGTDDIFDSMSMADLKKYAEENEIPVEGIKSREALLEAVRQYENLASPANR